MTAYLTPMLCLLGAWMTQVRRNRALDMTALALISLTIILIAGLRAYADVDYPLYVEMYHDNPTLESFSLDAISRLYGEPGYLYLTAIFKSLDAGFGAMALVCAIVSVTLKAVMLSKFCRHASLALCLYLCLHFLTNEFIQLRWAVATGLMSMAFVFQYRRSYLWAALLFAMSLAIHYFTLVFVLVAFAVSWFRSHRALYAIVGASLVVGMFIQNDDVARFLMFDSQLYILARITRYAESVSAPLGAFSFLKLVLYPVTYLVCVRMRPSYAWRDDPVNDFLVRLAFLSIALTLAISFQPILHYRATILADLFGIVLALNAISIAFERQTRTAVFACLVLLFGTWYALDLRNNVAADRLFDYQTWLTS